MSSEVGSSPYVKMFPNGEPPQFVISEITWHSQSKEAFTVKPFGGKKVYLHEWYHNESAFTSPKPPREELATYTETNPEQSVYISDPQRADFTFREAIFHSAVNGTAYRVAERLIPEGLQQGDEVTLTIAGCCSIVDVRKGGIEQNEPDITKQLGLRI